MSVFRRYADVLAPDGAAAALTASVVGRVSLGTTGLAVLLLARHTTGSYAVAGAVSASYAVSLALAAPGRARAADRSGPVRVLVVCGVLNAAALCGFVVLAATGSGGVLLCLGAVVAGLTVPPVGAVMRALWGELASGPALTSAYSLESVVVELCFVLGPLLVAGLTAVSGPSLPVLASAALSGTGSLWLAGVPRLREVRPHEGRPVRRAGPLVSAAVRSLLLTVLWIGAGFGAIEVAVPAFAEQHGSRPGTGGVLLAVWSFGSILGGLAYGARQPRAQPHRQLPILVALLTVGTLLPLLAGSIVALGVCLVAYGSTVAPFSTCNSVLLGRSAPAGTTTEAFAWNGSMIFGGAAAGSAVAGLLVEAYGATAGLAVTAGAGLLTLGCSVAGLPALRRAA